MEIIIGKNSGFCAGVKHTVESAFDIVKNSNKKIYCLGEIVHNERVIKSLEDEGMIIVHDIKEVPDNETVLIRAHGEKKEVYDYANNHNMEIKDLSCGRVLIIRKKIEKYLNDSFILILGDKNHPEVLGTKSFSGDNSHVISSLDEIDEFIKVYKESKLKKLYIVAQTTFSLENFEIITSKIKELIKDEIIIDNTICDATRNRQNSVRELAKDVEQMLIVGGKKSANTKELYNIAKYSLDNVHLIQDVNDLKEITIDKNKKLGIMAGASTPQIVIDEIIEYLNK